MSETNLNIKTLGQVFTPTDIVKKMIALRENHGTILEPSCGAGAFFSEIPGCVGIELDGTKAPEGALVMDFFDYSESNKFDTIIGNPPYVRFQDINETTKAKLDMELFDKRSNLYLFFIYKCVHHLNPNGELIFIVPRDLLKATSAAKLNQYLYEKGTVTYIEELGDIKVFKEACPNTIIFRFEKDNFSRKTSDGKTFSVIKGQMVFSQNEKTVRFSDLFSVKVGAASGANKLFESEKGNIEFVYSETAATGNLKRMFYNTPAKELLPVKEKLLNRKIRKFDESNWYEWGRKYYESDSERIYVNQKTRRKEPFFYNACKAYDGSVLAIFPKFEADEALLREIAGKLNKIDWEELGFICDGRYLFTQRSLENIVLPADFAGYLKNRKSKLAKTRI